MRYDDLSDKQRAWVDRVARTAVDAVRSGDCPCVPTAILRHDTMPIGLADLATGLAKAVLAGELDYSKLDGSP
jgi:hypothetical protein